MILGVPQVVVGVADVTAAEAPLLAAGFTRTFAEPALASHPAKAPLLSRPREALAMVHLTAPSARPAVELTSYGAPGGTAAFVLEDDRVRAPTDDPAASTAFWAALGRGEDDVVGGALPGWRLAVAVEPSPARAGATTLDADGCVLVTVATTKVAPELRRLQGLGVLRRAAGPWSEQVAGRALEVAIVEGPGGELVELLEVGSRR